MGTISVSLPSDGTTADVADYNTPITSIVNEFNGNIDNDNVKATAGIDVSKLSGDWKAWTPTLSSRLNNTKWTKNCKYVKIGKTVHFRLYIVANTTTPMDGETAEAVFTLPVAATEISSQVPTIGVAGILDAGTARYTGFVEYHSTTTARIRYIDTNAAIGGDTAISSTLPFTWTTNDEIFCQGTYEAA